jgi:hypothetical protein
MPENSIWVILTKKIGYLGDIEEFGLNSIV